MGKNTYTLLVTVNWLRNNRAIYSKIHKFVYIFLAQYFHFEECAPVKLQKKCKLLLCNWLYILIASVNSKKKITQMFTNLVMSMCQL